MMKQTVINPLYIYKKLFLNLININFFYSMESNYIEIDYINKKEYILQYISESNNNFELRLNYIRKLEKHNVSWDDAIKLSLLWYNIKFRKCKYNKDLYIKVISYDK